MDSLVAILVFVIGAPLINLAKYYFVTWLDSKPTYFTTSPSRRCGDNVEDVEGKNERTELKTMISTNIKEGLWNTNELLEFVMEIIEHVQNTDCSSDLDFAKFGNDDWKKWKAIHSQKTSGNPDSNNECRDLLTTYQKIHDDTLWNESVKTIFGMGNMFFENDGNKIDKYNKTLHILEKLIHAGVNNMVENETEVDLCLKVHFGNHVVTKMLWSSEPPCIRSNVYSKIPLPGKVNKFFHSSTFKKITLYLGLIIETVSYYLDLVKDISILILFCHVTYPFWDSFSTFVEYLAATLLLTIILPEALKASYFYANHKYFINTTSTLNVYGKCLVGGFMFGFAPLLSNILFYERFKIGKELFSRKEVLFEEIDYELRRRRQSQEVTIEEKWKTLSKIKKDLEEYYDLILKRQKYFRIMTSAKHLEANTESFYQYITHLIIIIISHMTIVHLSRHESDNLQKDHLYRMFYDYPTGAFLLYFSVTRAFISMIGTRTSTETDLKNLFFPDNAKIFFGFYSLVSLFVKIFSVIIFWVPSLGLYGFATHRWMARIQFNEIANRCITTRDKEDWNTLGREYQKQPYYGLDICFTSYVVIVMVGCSMLLYILKTHLLTSSFRGGGWVMVPKKLMHISNCIIFPSITQDWDEDFSTVNAK